MSDEEPNNIFILDCQNCANRDIKERGYFDYCKKCDLYISKDTKTIPLCIFFTEKT